MAAASFGTAGPFAVLDRITERSPGDHFWNSRALILLSVRPPSHFGDIGDTPDCQSPQGARGRGLQASLASLKRRTIASIQWTAMCSPRDTALGACTTPRGISTARIRFAMNHCVTRASLAIKAPSQRVLFDSCSLQPRTPPLSSTASASHRPEAATSAAVIQIAGNAAWASCAIDPRSSAPMA